MLSKNKLKKLKILAIIPARGDSKGLQQKNIKPLIGKPLIAWTIEQSKQSKLIDRCIVNTDNSEIKRIAHIYGAETPFLRPKKLARSTTSIYKVIIHTLNYLQKQKDIYDIIVLLEPTSPLRKDGDIDNAIQLFINNIHRAQSLVSVGEIHIENPYIDKKISYNFVKPFIHNHINLYQRQQFPKVYFPYGVIYMSTVEAFKKYKTFYQKKTIPYFIERWQNYEIDDIYDFLFVETILKHKLFTADMPSKQYHADRIIIQGKRVYLKNFTREHLYDKRYLTWLRDREVVKSIGRNEYLDKPVSLLEIEEYVKGLWLSDNNLFFALYHKKNNTFIGTFKIGKIDWQAKTADIGIMIGNKLYWGHGLCKDILTSVCHYAFSNLGIRKLTGGCFENNIAMCKCFEYVGFHKEGVREKQYLLEGTFVNHILYGLFKQELYSRHALTEIVIKQNPKE